MSEDIKVIITLIVAVITLLTAIFGVRKAYIELKKVISEKKAKSKCSENDSMNNKLNNRNTVTNSKNKGNISNSIDSHNTTIFGDVLMQDKVQLNQKINNISDDNIILKDRYTSLFAEKGRIYSEKIVIRNLGNGKIEGDVYLDKNHTYSLSGTFRNCILTGEFTSVGQYTDERGTINLKLISENILSGFCSFSKISKLADDQIRMSPYIWIAGEDSSLLNGTYEFCTQCHNEGKKCCCSSHDIDMPILLNNEAKKIQSINPRLHRMRDFSHNIGNTQVRQMNEAGDSPNEYHCHFYDCNENRCKIYDIRPTDCRLFPFDIKLDTNTNEYWIGFYSDLCDRQLPDIEVMKQYAHILRPQLFLLFPYANTINDISVCKHLSKASFEKLYKLEQFIF